MNSWGSLQWAGAALLIPVFAGCALSGKASNSEPAATVERLEVVQRKPALGGASFGDVGEYEMVVAVAHVTANPRHRVNERIVDLGAATGPDGRVHYATDVVFLRPRNADKASRVLVVDVANRGRKLMLQLVDDGELPADTAAQAGNGWLMRQGHTLAWIVWQGDVALDRSGRNVGMALPVATDRGAPITGTSLEELVFDAPGAAGAMPLSYPAVLFMDRF